MEKMEYFKHNIINTSENYIEYLDFLSRGNIYVLPTEAQIDVYSQKKDVSILNTITGWSKVGYGVKNSEEPIFIKNNEKEMYLFDISQTGIRDEKTITQNLSWTGEMAIKAGIHDLYFFLVGKDAAFIETEQNINKIFEKFSSEKKAHWKEFALASLKYIIGERLGESNKREMQAAKSRVKGLFYLDNPILMPEYAYKVIEELSKTVTKEFRKASEYIENTSKISKQEDETSFAEQVDKSLNGTLSPYTTLKVCDTPQSLLDVGCDQLPMLYTQRHLKNAINPDSQKEHFHGLSVEQIKKLPNLLKNPVMIYDSLSKNDSIVAVTSEVDKNNNPIIVSIKPNGEGRYELETIEANFITSVHGRENFINQIKNVIKQDKMLFCDKKKSQEIFDRWGLQLSELTNILSFDIIIHQSRNIINNKLQENKQLSIFKENNLLPEASAFSDTDKTDNKEKEEMQLPTITCEWSESNIFENGKIYSVYEFDRLMKEADDKQIAGRNAAVLKYGSMENWLEEEEYNEFTQFLGYEKTKFNINMPDGSIYTERQDIGDGDGGVIDFLRKNPEYSNIIPILEKARDIEKFKLEQTDEYVNNNIIENPRDEGFEAEDNISNQKIISVTGDKSRYQANISAIRTLKQLETENRLPSTEYERETLKNYQGWGGCQDAFDVRKEKWSKEYEELKELLDDKEYKEARASVNTAFYTSPRVIESIYTILGNMGFTGGRILDPAMGTGRFYQYMPDDIKSRSELYGVEIDGISGRIAKMLNPDAHIDIQGGKF